jgi:hypothetical protein
MLPRSFCDNCEPRFFAHLSFSLVDEIDSMQMVMLESDTRYELSVLFEW